MQFHPNQQTSFIAGLANKKIVQFDTNSGELVQTYEDHQGSINSLNFIEHGKRFVSSADDKKIYLWEFGIPVVAKYISSPDMHSIPVARMHPFGNNLVGQSMDDKLVVFDCKVGIRPNKSKVFVGHKNQGFGCGISFSPDGQFVCSGDSEGGIWFWDWKTTKNYRTLKAHEGVTIDIDWHPLHPSKIASAGWDGTIKLWE